MSAHNRTHAHTHTQARVHTHCPLLDDKRKDFGSSCWGKSRGRLNGLRRSAHTLLHVAAMGTLVEQTAARERVGLMERKDRQPLSSSKPVLLCKTPPRSTGLARPASVEGSQTFCERGKLTLNPQRASTNEQRR